MNARWTAAAAIAGSLICGAEAHASGLHYRVWTIEDGLPTGSVRAIAQTGDGYLWIGTLDGLVRFDGVRMRVFQRSQYPQMTSNRCLSLLVDRAGDLWVGTEDGGLLRFRGDEIRAFGVAAGLPSLRIGWLREDEAGNFWAESTNGPVVRDGERFRPDTLGRALRSSPQGVAHEGANGRRWVLEGGYLRRRDAGNWETFPDPVPAAILPRPNDMFEDREGTLWIGGDGGLVQASATAVRALVPAGRLDANVYTLAPDREGRVWLGTNTHPAVWERRTGRFAPLAGRSWWPRDGVTTIEADVDGTLLAGGPLGLFHIRPGHRAEQIRPEAGEPRDFLRNRHGTLWVAVEGGVFRQTAEGWARLEGLPSNDPKVLLESKDGSLWIGTYGGVSRVSQGAMRTWTEADGLGSNRVRSLHEDASGTLWIGTYDGGLGRLADGKLTSIRQRDGLFDDGAFAILEDDAGRFWVSSNRGVYAVRRKDLDDFAAGTLRRIPCRAWTSRHGMPSSECNGGRQPSGFRADDGTLWFPTQRGIAVIDPRAVAVNTTPPLVVIEGITTDRRSIAVGPSITLAPGERRLEVGYTANTFVNPEGTRFRHRLIPFDTDWVEAGDRRFAQYALLPPGRYTLQVIAANSDGVWSPVGASLALRALPFWWQTVWFRAAAVALLAGVLTSAYRRRVSRLKRRRAEQDAFARSLLESQEAERKRIAGELHDGLGMTLVVIRNRALLGLQDGGDPAREIAEISKEAAEGIQEVRKIAYGLRPYQIDRLGLRRALAALVEQVAASSGIPIAAEIGEVDGTFPEAAEISVYRMLQEGLNNLARHARARSGRVTVAVADGEIAITIEDDGAGFDPASLGGGGGLGLSGIAERARILGGRSAIRSSPGQGTTVSVHLPRTGGVR